MQHGIELSEVIKNLRASLTTAQTEGVDERLKFAIDEVEVELQIAVTDKTDVKAGVKFWVIDAGAGAGQDSSATQKITLKMKVVDAVTGKHADIRTPAGPR